MCKWREWRKYAGTRPVFWFALSVVALVGLLSMPCLDWQLPVWQPSVCDTRFYSLLAVMIVFALFLVARYYFRDQRDGMGWGVVNIALPLFVIVAPVLFMALLPDGKDSCPYQHWLDKAVFKAHSALWELVTITAIAVWWEVERHFDRRDEPRPDDWRLLRAACVVMGVVGALFYSLPLPVDYLDAATLAPYKLYMALLALLAGTVFPLIAMYILLKLTRSEEGIYP